jgi:hypothetical protein
LAVIAENGQKRGELENDLKTLAKEISQKEK